MLFRTVCFAVCIASSGLAAHAETVLSLTPELTDAPIERKEPLSEPASLEVPDAAQMAPAPVETPVPPPQETAEPATAAPESPAAAAPQAPAEPGDLWERIRNGFALPATDHWLVTRHSAQFAGNPAYVERIVQRSRRYLFHIIEEVEARGMPSEIALLPIVESAFNPKAYSRARASGIWQFIPATGKHYGLSQNWWYDGRRDIIAATGAALDYLQALHNMFGDWQLALAAYNCGEGCVRRAVARNRAAGLPTDFASLSLPRETRNYVPKLLGVRDIVGAPERYGLALAPIPNERYFAPVSTTRHIDVQRAAQFAEISEQEFLDLNPAYNGPVITAHTEQIILVPAEKAEFFRANLENPEHTLVSWKTYKLQRGASFDKVAGSFGLTGAELKRVNGISASKRVAGGGTILVPSGGAGEHELPAQIHPEAYVPAPPPPVTVLRHAVRRGESLGSIARRYRVGVSQIAAWNNLRARRIVTGQVLSIHKARGAVLARAAGTERRGSAARYVVRRGDSWFSIAKRFNVSVANLHAWNKTRGQQALIAGKRIIVRS
jgi:membrane-bound lytic murein transglycosylase D